MTQDKPRKIAEVGVGEGGQLRLLALREYDVICVPEHMPFTYPENPVATGVQRYGRWRV